MNSDKNDSRKDFFNDMAAIWDDKYLNPKLLSFLEEFVPLFDIKSGEKVLDVGTGTGVLIPFLLKNVGSSGLITAVDYAENMVEICRKKHSHNTNVTILIQDVEKMDFNHEAFDTITCFGLFPHLNNINEALRNFYYVLKPEGKLIIAHALSSEEIKEHHMRSESVYGDDLPEVSEMINLLNKAGFKEVTVRDETGLYLCKSKKLSQ
ncbi:class I SAM-dependent methyltransferase [Candidatus Bathyarchaeota archaeon]|nr:class I SAM-dependent methyltransferase [Candidatus Bathyarchaeota archaeon]